jgi:hypothetical protein
MRKRTVQTLMLGGVSTAVVTVCSLAIFGLSGKPQARDAAFSVSLQEKRSIRPVEAQQSQRLYNCRADAKPCAIAAVQEACGNNEYEITFEKVHVDANGQLDGEWGYRCFSRNGVL